MTGAGVSGESGQAPVLIAVLEKWKDLGSVAHLVPSVAENIARGEIMRFSRVHVLVRSKVGTGLSNQIIFISIVSCKPVQNLGLIITGGESTGNGVKSVEVEMFVPSTGRHCTLPDLPGGRGGHTMEEMVLCGGGDSVTRRSCLTLTEAGWETTTYLLEQR